MLHDFSIEGLGVQTPLLSAKGATTDIVFCGAAQAGTYDYYCTVSGHRQLVWPGSSWFADEREPQPKRISLARGQNDDNL